jgi:hypothetical protein
MPEGVGEPAGGTARPPATSTGPDAAGAPTDPLVKERARALLYEAGLAKPPARSTASRRVVLLAAVILVVLVVIVAASLTALGHLSSSSTTTTTVPASTTTTTVPVGHLSAAAALAAFATASRDPALLQSVGAGGQPMDFARSAAPTFITDAHRRPVVVYWWSGDCSPCAPENLVVASALEALGGTFRGLAPGTEPGPSPTLDLRHARYHGPVVLDAAEVTGPTGRPDQATGAQAAQQFHAFDARPYTPFPGAFPFLDVGGRYVMVGPDFSSALLAGSSFQGIAGRLGTPDDVVTRAVVGSANLLTAAVCVTLSELSQPLPIVCANPAIVALESQLPSVPPHGAHAP